MLEGFNKFWRNILKCWRYGHEWTDEEIKRVYGTKYKTKYCTRCNMTRRGDRIMETVETPLDPEELRGIIFCPVCGINSCYTEEEAALKNNREGVVISSDRIYCNACDSDLLLLNRGDHN